MTQRKTVLCIFGTRPEAIKMVPVIRALQANTWARCVVVVTAQHRDMLDQMLTRFGISVDYDLNLMQPGQSPDQVLARMLPELEGIIQTEQSYAVLAQGNTATVFGAALDYFDFVAAMQAAHLILTDSGGVQEEAPALGKPVLVLRQTTERPEPVSEGVAQLVGTKQATIVQQAIRLLNEPEHYQDMARVCMPYGDGTTGVKLTQLLKKPV